MTTSLSYDDQEIVKQVIDKYANTGIFLIHAEDKLLTEFYAIQISLAGISEKNAPQLMKLWHETKQSQVTRGSLKQAFTENAKPVHSITSLASQDGSNFSAEAIGSLPVSATNVTQTLGFFDGQGSPAGKVALNQNFVKTSNCSIQASGQYSENLEKTDFPVNIIYTFAQTINGTTLYGAQIVSSQSYPKSIINIAPTDVNGNQEIKVCLTRNTGDCDYIHDYGGELKLPIQGSITYFENIDVQANQPVNASNSIYIIREREGGDPVTPRNGFNLFTQPNTHIDGDTLSWNLDWLPFNPPDFNSGEMVYYVFEVTLQIQGRPVVSYISNAPKSLVPGQQVLNTYPIKPMQIVYGCLGEKTLILMADGKERVISDIQEGDWVCSQDKRKLRVEQVIKGFEDNALILHIAIKGQKDHTLVTSPGHPFVTSEGVVTAQELTLESRLVCQSGEANIKAINTVDGKTTVFNLHLSTDNTRELTKDNRTMYANGVLVGDSVMQRHYEDEFQLRPENLLAQLPKEWHQDLKYYLTTLK
jgi:hypothetical protein